jgi:mono/diheme cytochrome c family protein
MKRLVTVLVLGLAACGGDDEVTPDAAGGNPDAGGGADAMGPDAGPVASAARGEYLVKHVGACGDCHTPRNMDGSLDETKALSGVECFADIDPMTPNVGCLHTRNLTNHATGLMNRSDAEIKAMFQNGVRPNGDALWPVMPYYVFHNMTDVDAQSIVLYLRTVPGIDHTVPANEPPFNTPPPAAAQPIDPATIPMPSTVNASTMNGRYLAGMAGVCMECHTKRTNPMDPASLDTANFFAGGEGFPAAAFGLPVPPFPDVIYSANITPDNATGIGMHTVEQIVAIIKQGTDKDGNGVCPPMPVGPMGAFGGLTDGDATDIASYLLAIPAKPANGVANGCAIPAP